MLSMDEDDPDYGPATPLSYKDLFLGFFCSSDEGSRSTIADSTPEMEPAMPNSEILGTAPQPGEEEPEKGVAAINDTAEKMQFPHEPLHPDIMADVRAHVHIDKRHMTATTA